MYSPKFCLLKMLSKIIFASLWLRMNSGAHTCSGACAGKNWTWHDNAHRSLPYSRASTYAPLPLRWVSPSRNRSTRCCRLPVNAASPALVPHQHSDKYPTFFNLLFSPARFKCYNSFTYKQTVVVRIDGLPFERLSQQLDFSVFLSDRRDEIQDHH